MFRLNLKQVNRVVTGAVAVCERPAFKNFRQQKIDWFATTTRQSSTTAALLNQETSSPRREAFGKAGRSSVKTERVQRLDKEIVEDFLNEDDVEVLPDKEVQSTVGDKKFPVENFAIHPTIVGCLKQVGIHSLFEVQVETLKGLKESSDLIVRSRTGSGKTLAFGLPLLQRILEEKEKEKLSGNPRIGKPLGIVMTPTRELALQIHTELTKYCSSLNGTTVYGGTSYTTQIGAINDRRVPIDYIVGTPGRLNDLLQSNKLDLSEIKVSVLDEADEMLKIGFKQEIDNIFSVMPELSKRQNLLFSATFDSAIQGIARSYMKKFKLLNLVGDDEEKIPNEIELVHMVTQFSTRKEALANILATYCSGDEAVRALVFSNSKALCDEIASCPEINSTGVNCVALHGDMSQKLRENALNAFRENKVRCVIATDVAARGLDVPKVDLVVHFGLPDKMTSFVHRTGRTGRAGRKGVNILLHDQRDMNDVRSLEKLTNRTFIRKTVPSSTQLTLKKLERTVETIVGMHPKRFSLFLNAAQDLCNKKLVGVQDVPNKQVSAKINELVASAISCAVGFVEQKSFSVLSGKEGFMTLMIKDNASHSLGLPNKNSLKKNRNGGFEINSEEAKQVESNLVNRVNAIMSKGKNPSGPIRLGGFEVLEDLSGCMVDLPVAIADKVLEGAHLSETDKKSVTIVEDVVPALIVKPNIDGRSWGGGSRSEDGRGDFRSGHSRGGFGGRDNRQERGPRQFRSGEGGGQADSEGRVQRDGFGGGERKDFRSGGREGFSERGRGFGGRTSGDREGSSDRGRGFGDREGSSDRGRGFGDRQGSSDRGRGFGDREGSNDRGRSFGGSADRVDSRRKRDY